MESSPTLVIGVPPKEAMDPYEVMGSSVVATWLIWHPTSGEMYIDMLSILGLGLGPMADDCLALALQELPDLD